jgi:hypothetical protein
MSHNKKAFIICAAVSVVIYSLSLASVGNQDYSYIKNIPGEEQKLNAWVTATMLQGNWTMLDAQQTKLENTWGKIDIRLLPGIDPSRLTGVIQPAKNTYIPIHPTQPSPSPKTEDPEQSQTVDESVSPDIKKVRIKKQDPAETPDPSLTADENIQNIETPQKIESKTPTDQIPEANLPTQVYRSPVYETQQSQAESQSE